VPDDSVAAADATFNQVTGGPPAVVPGDPANVYTLLQTAGNPESIGGGFRFSLFYKADGLRAWSARDSSNRVDQHDIAVAYSLLSADWTLTASDTVGWNDPRGIFITPDGTKIISIFGSGSGNIIRQEPFSTPFDLSTIGASTGSKVVKTGMAAMDWKSDGLKCWIMSGAGVLLDGYSVPTPFDITTLITTPVETFDMSVDAGVGVDTFVLSADGTKLYSITTTNLLCSWDLTTPFDVSTATNFVTGLTKPAPVSIARGMFYRADNGDIFIEGDQNTQSVASFTP